MHRGLVVGLTVLMSALALVAMVAGCSGHAALAPPLPGPDGGYATSRVCATCHPAQYAVERQSGHPYKLTKITGGQPPIFPFSFVPTPPPGTGWSNVSYVIGGYGWKARFMDLQGFIRTGNAVQYNLATQQFVPYKPEIPDGTKPYDCGACHTTGWVASGPGGPHQDGLLGIYGTFAEPGITCEACHGPGMRHSSTASPSDITIDRSKEMCGRCHFRDANHRIAAHDDGFIDHHEQYDELISARHAGLECLDCHSAHTGVLYGQGGIVRRCEGCHTQQAKKTKHNDTPGCEDCHMPDATKSAMAFTPYKADVATHIFKINTNPVDKSAMFFEEGGLFYTKPFVTLDFACYNCHKDPNGVGGNGSVKTLAELSAYAKGMHD